MEPVQWDRRAVNSPPCGEELELQAGVSEMFTAWFQHGNLILIEDMKSKSSLLISLF